MKKGLKGLLGLFIVALVALVIALNINMPTDGVTNLLSGNGNFQNLSGAVQLNLTMYGNASGTTGGAGNPAQFSFNWTNVTFMFSNTSDAYMYNVTVLNSTQNDTYFNTTFNTALLADGVYNLSINYTNVSSDSGQNISQLGYSGYNITIDNTPPTVTQNVSNTIYGLTAANNSNITASTGNVSINFTIYDFKPTSVPVRNGAEVAIQSGLFNISVITLTLSNGTGRDLVFTNLGGNATSQGNITNISGVWVVNYNLSSLFEGTQGGVLTVNDTQNNTVVVIFNFTVDRTAPTMTFSTSGVSATSAKVLATTNESVSNCTYATVAGAQGSLGTAGNLSQNTAGTLTVHSKTFSSLTASTGYQITVTCTDFAGYAVTGTHSFTTTAAAAAASSGGSGSGGSSGGISTGAQGSFEKKVWTSINAGETASVALKNGVLGVTEVSFSVPATVYGVWVSVSKRDSLPSSLPAFSGKVYRNIEITKGPALAKAGAYTDAMVNFKVEKAWFVANALTKEAVALYHNENGEWTQLTTTVGEDDGTYVHYSAKTPSFSYFVIGQKSGAVAAAPEAETVPTVEAPVVEAPVVEEPVAEQKSAGKGWLVGLLVAAVVVVAVVLYMRKKR